MTTNTTTQENNLVAEFLKLYDELMGINSKNTKNLKQGGAGK